MAEHIGTSAAILGKAQELVLCNYEHRELSDHYSRFSQYDMESFVCAELYMKREKWNLSEMTEEKMKELIMQKKAPVLRAPFKMATEELFTKVVSLS